MPDLLNIWIPFFRVENATQRQLSSKGSGIGLYLVSEILKAHNADYSITNVKNGVKASFSINKTISVSILKPIDPGLNKEEFLNLLENNIYSELDKIN